MKHKAPRPHRRRNRAVVVVVGIGVFALGIGALSMEYLTGPLRPLAAGEEDAALIRTLAGRALTTETPSAEPAREVGTGGGSGTGRSNPGGRGSGEGKVSPTPTATERASTSTPSPKAEPSPTESPEPTSSPKPSPEPEPTKSATPTPPPSPPTSSPKPTEEPPSENRQKKAEDEVVRLVNVERREAGCDPLRNEERIRDASRTHSEDMAANEYFSHTSLDGRTPWDRMREAGYESPGAENIARGQQSAEAVVQSWMDSEGHRENILNCELVAVGVGVAFGDGGPWWTQGFGYK